MTWWQSIWRVSTRPASGSGLRWRPTRERARKRPRGGRCEPLAPLFLEGAGGARVAIKFPSRPTDPMTTPNLFAASKQVPGLQHLLAFRTRNGPRERAHALRFASPHLNFSVQFPTNRYIIHFRHGHTGDQFRDQQHPAAGCSAACYQPPIPPRHASPRMMIPTPPFPRPHGP